MTNWNRRSLLRVAGQSASLAALGAVGGYAASWAAEVPADTPDDIINPVEITGPDAVPVLGRLPGAQRMYVLPAGSGEFHRVGGFMMTRLARPIETGGIYEVLNFAGRTGAAMPRHLHRMSHVGMVVMGGDIEFELDGKKWQMMRGDFANIPPGTPHSWTMKSDRSQITLFAIGNRVGSAFAAMGAPSTTNALASGQELVIAPAKLADAAFAGDFMRVVEPAPAGDAVRVTNLLLPQVPGPYVLLDGGGERFGSNTICAKNSNTGGQMLLVMTEAGAGGPGVEPHFHARHTEDFYAVDGETIVWTYGKAVPLRPGDLIQSPPRHLHGFKFKQEYNRFVGFLTPGIFEAFFTRGKAGENGVGGHVRTPWASRARQLSGSPSDRFRALMMSATGPDGYPLDLHGPTLALPPQDPIWLESERTGMLERSRSLYEHAMVMCGGTGLSTEITPDLQRALALKPKATDFI